MCLKIVIQWLLLLVQGQGQGLIDAEENSRKTL